jgi:hypothetical protein
VLPYSGTDNRRSDLRLQHAAPEKGELRIVCYDGRTVHLKPALAEVLDISPSGCGFRSPLRFPVSPLLLVRLEYRIHGESLNGLGQLRWRLPDENGYRYGMRFLLTRGERTGVRRMLNLLILRACPGQTRIHRLYREQVEDAERRGGDRSGSLRYL